MRRVLTLASALGLLGTVLICTQQREEVIFFSPPLQPVSYNMRAQAFMKAKAPKGPFGGSGGPEDGWVGDQGRSEQVKKFEAGQDYLFFQGPAPMTAVQEDLPSFFSAENLAPGEIISRITLPQIIAIGGALGGTAALLAFVLTA